MLENGLGACPILTIGWLPRPSRFLASHWSRLLLPASCSPPPAFFPGLLYLPLSMDQVQFPVFSQCPSTGRMRLRYSFFKNVWPYTLQECMAMYCMVLLPPTSPTKHLCCSPTLLLLFVYPHTICCLFNLPTPFCCPLLVPPPLNSSSCVCHPAVLQLSTVSPTPPHSSLVLSPSHPPPALFLHRLHSSAGCSATWL